MVIHKSLIKYSAPAILIALVSYGLFSHHYHWWPFTQNVTTVEKTVNTSPKNSNVPAKSDAQATPSSGKTSNEVPVSPAASASITELADADGKIQFSANIQGLAAGGTCVLTFSNPNDRPVTKQFAPITKAGAVACATSVPAYEFSYLGTWAVSLHYYSGSQQVTAGGEVNVK